MKILLLMNLILVSFTMAACAPAKNTDATQSSATPAPTEPPVAQAPTCAIYDSCTYTGGLVPQPVFNCVAKTLKAVDHPEIDASYFEGETCLTYREDFHTVQSYCGPMNQFPCSIQEQGPGPEAIPALNL